jgi:hypothetical protein
MLILQSVTGKAICHGTAPFGTVIVLFAELICDGDNKLLRPLQLPPTSRLILRLLRQLELQRPRRPILLWVLSCRREHPGPALLLLPSLRPADLLRP